MNTMTSIRRASRLGVVFITTGAVFALPACSDPARPAPPPSPSPTPAPPPPPPINLLTAAPAVVAVSSTVANPAIVPAHLVDGDLGTAWNSRTGELRGAWIGARVPADAQVTAIRMTVGFTKLDPTLGDLFTMNPRIHKVRVRRNDAPILEHTLDVDMRTLQDIPIHQPGGDYNIEVVEVIAGTKPQWREVSVSELEIWGTLAAGTLPKPLRPAVRVGSFDPLRPAECVAVMFPAAKDDRVTLEHGPEVISKVDVVELTPEVTLCRVEHTRVHSEPWDDGPHKESITKINRDTAIELAPVTRTPRPAAGKRTLAAINTQVSWEFPPGSQGIGDYDYETHTVAVTIFPLTSTENAALIDVSRQQSGVHLNNQRTTSTLYRVSATGLTSVLSYETNGGTLHEDNGDIVEVVEHCQLAPPTSSSVKPPPSLALACEHTEQTTGRSTRTEKRSNTVSYDWDGSAYAPRGGADPVAPHGVASP